MSYNIKNYFQNIHYSRQKANFALNFALLIGEFFYSIIINLKNLLYRKNVLKEKKVNAYVICVGNLTTGGVGKTPVVIELANKISEEKRVAVISRGYKSKLSNKSVNVIKDYKGVKFENGLICGDEPFQLAKKVKKSVVVLTCSNRYIAAQEAIIKYASEVIILDDGFSNRSLKKDKIILAIDSKMRFGNGRLLPAGPLREPIKEIKRADEIILVDKGDSNIQEAADYIKKFGLPMKICKMVPKKIYNALTKAQIIQNQEEQEKIIAFCAIGQPEQFFDFLKKNYILADKISFEDHHKYSKGDIKNLIKIAKSKNVRTFVTTQKDETKLLNLIKDIKGYSFNVLELQNIIEEIK